MSKSDQITAGTLPHPTGLVLASSSPYRRELLSRLGVPFNWEAPSIDEAPLAGESAGELVRRLASAKAIATASSFPSALVIGSDQVAINGDTVLGKPGLREAAVAQLAAASGRKIRFLTSLCVLDSATGQRELEVVPTDVWFRELSTRQINHYVDWEQPYDCAGSFKVEGLGIVLFDRIVSDDPTALQGLPLISLVELLKRFAYDPLERLPPP
jgi:septum formation protein